MRKDAELLNEYREFIEGAKVARPSLEQGEMIVQSARRRLSPSLWSVSGKAGLIHLLSSFVTLFLCPQFGVGIFSEGHGLMHLFMRFGNFGCFLLCGAFFFSSSVLVMSLLFSRPEWRVFRGHVPLQLLYLVTGSLLGFMIADAEFMLTITVAWIMGAVIGSYLSSWLGDRVLKMRTAA